MLLRYRYSAIILLLACITGTAQSLPDIYYNEGWKKCDAAKACYLAKTIKTDSGYYRTDFFVNNGALQMAALYEDSVCKLVNGTAAWFYASGIPARQVKMLHGKTEGVDVRYHNN